MNLWRNRILSALFVLGILGGLSGLMWIMIMYPEWYVVFFAVIATIGLLVGAVTALYSDARENIWPGNTPDL